METVHQMNTTSSLLYDTAYISQLALLVLFSLAAAIFSNKKKYAWHHIFLSLFQLAVVFMIFGTIVFFELIATDFFLKLHFTVAIVMYVLGLATIKAAFVAVHGCLMIIASTNFVVFFLLLYTEIESNLVILLLCVFIPTVLFLIMYMILLDNIKKRQQHIVYPYCRFF